VSSKHPLCCAAALFLLGWAPLCGSGGAAEVHSELLAGYAGGPGGQMGLLVSHFVERSPLSVRFALGYDFLSPGNAEDARRIFINDADNGTPEQTGHAFVWRLDLVAPLGARGSGWSLYAGPRYSRFTASFKFVGGDEDFDVRCHQWGVGGGAEYTAPMSPGVSLRVSGGADYFFPAALDGHDTLYRPDNDNVNAHHDYTYQDADRAIDQPTLQFRVQAGVTLRLGP